MAKQKAEDNLNPTNLSNVAGTATTVDDFDTVINRSDEKVEDIKIVSEGTSEKNPSTIGAGYNTETLVEKRELTPERRAEGQAVHGLYEAVDAPDGSKKHYLVQLNKRQRITEVKVGEKTYTKMFDVGSGAETGYYPAMTETELAAWDIYPLPSELTVDGEFEIVESLKK